MNTAGLPGSGGDGEAVQPRRSRSLTTRGSQKRDRSREHKAADSLWKWAAQLDLQKAERAMRQQGQGSTCKDSRKLARSSSNECAPLYYTLRDSVPTPPAPAPSPVEVEPATTSSRAEATTTPDEVKPVSSTHVHTALTESDQSKLGVPPEALQALNSSYTSLPSAAEEPVCVQKPWVCTQTGRRRRGPPEDFSHNRVPKKTDSPTSTITSTSNEKTGVSEELETSAHDTTEHGLPAPIMQLLAFEISADSAPDSAPSPPSPPVLRVGAASESHTMMVRSSMDTDFVREQQCIIHLCRTRLDMPSPNPETSPYDSRCGSPANHRSIAWCSLDLQQQSGNKHKKRVQFADSMGQELTCIKHFSCEEPSRALPVNTSSHLVLHTMLQKGDEPAEALICEQLLSELQLEELQTQERGTMLQDEPVPLCSHLWNTQVGPTTNQRLDAHSLSTSNCSSPREDEELSHRMRLDLLY
ncbi:hypothetical protein NDU88_004549 [Pleurodeles waltl]|uniref:Uncharacterized protein n=1 Tax=Pleurodeles waltl TaxID=8319 RepID=A0AAV7VHE4_PLEWA|nr:hypothetical protein NDU88_004549 [Pleurodeles waltl]